MNNKFSWNIDNDMQAMCLRYEGRGTGLCVPHEADSRGWYSVVDTSPTKGGELAKAATHVLALQHAERIYMRGAA